MDSTRQPTSAAAPPQVVQTQLFLSYRYVLIYIVGLYTAINIVSWQPYAKNFKIETVEYNNMGCNTNNIWTICHFKNMCRNREEVLNYSFFRYARAAYISTVKSSSYFICNFLVKLMRKFHKWLGVRFRYVLIFLASVPLKQV